MKKRNFVKLLMHVLCVGLLLSVALLASSCSGTANLGFELSQEEGGFIISEYNGRRANVTIPEEYSGLPVVAIADGVFKDNTHLKSIAIPSSVKKIGSTAFASCTKLKSVTLSDGLTSIGLACFSDCTSLESIVIPEGVKVLSSGEFLNCRALKSITLPSTLEALSYYSFMGCGSLSEIKISDKNSTYRVVDNCLIDTEKKELVIGTSKSVIPTDGSVTAIGEGAFYNRTSLADIAIPDAVDKIGEGAFYGCTSLASIQAPGASQIGIRAFFGCSSASYAILSDDLAKIDDFAFGDCSALKNVYFEGESAEWEKVEIAESTQKVLDKLTVSFYSEKAPAGEGSFWHFDGSTPTLWD